MQPEQLPGMRSQEHQPASHAESYEVPPNFAVHEMSPSSSPELAERRNAVELAPQIQAPVVINSTTVQSANPSIVPQPDPTAQNPTTANDDDVIEKEWVDRAKQVILQTKDNPHAREKAIGELQRDYLAKRYGRQVGASND